MDLFSNQVMIALVKELDAGALRQRVLANNIANVNTPDFKKSTVEFDSLLKQALDREPVEMITTDPRHFGVKPSLAELKPEVLLNKATTMRTDGNNVDIDEEMANLAANSMQYQAVAKELSERYSGLSYVISGGRR
ncbi:MAG: Flagellar basal body rod protein FlgB [Pelotomaculum sp. PtaB.Bin104]|nr:MAG: Flagellar basal body rod protein FlgB [Pelotomaculum sp. PtaB.Bin104]